MPNRPRESTRVDEANAPTIAIPSKSALGQQPGAPLAPSQGLSTGLTPVISPASSGDSKTLTLSPRIHLEIQGKLGEGGMGAVFRVLDLRLGRAAALKVVHTRKLDIDSRERFFREARITARLDHPAIPPVFEAGEREDGQLYILMRLISGETLDAWIKRAHQDGPASEAQQRDLVEAIVRVGEALSHAHGRKIIHRDVKPSNIMIGAHGEVLLLDWGVARDLEQADDRFERILKAGLSDSDVRNETGLTEAGAIIGTLGYMAPEQANGDPVDERCDVFALGVVIAEALTGRSPASGHSSLNLYAMTVEGRHIKPREVDGRIPADLDWIVRQALEVDREKRTPTTLELTRQLRAWLAGHQVPGYSYNRRERFQRLISRRPMLLISAFLALLALFVTAALGLQLQQARFERTLARLEQERSAELARVAEAELERQRAMRVAFQHARQLASRGAKVETIRAAVEKALGLAAKSDETALMSAAEIYQQAGDTESQKSILEQAVMNFPPAYEALFGLHSIAIGSTDNGFIMSEPLESLLALARERGDENEFILVAQADQAWFDGKSELALELYDKAEQLSNRLAWLYMNRGAVRFKLEQYERSLSDAERAVALSPNTPLAQHNLGLSYLECDRPEAALRAMNAAIARSPTTSSFYFSRGNIHCRLGLQREALADFDAALRLAPDSVEALTNRANIRDELGDSAGARADLERALAINPKHASAWMNLGAVLSREAADLERALDAFDRALQLKPDHAPTHVNRGGLLARLGRYDDALKEFSWALERNPKDTEALFNRGLSYSITERYEEALSDFNALLEIKPELPRARFNRGIVLEKFRRFDEAVADYDIAIAARYELPRALYYRGAIKLDQGDAATARRDLEASLALFDKNAEAWAELGRARFNLDDVTAALAAYDRAIALNPDLDYAYYARGVIAMRQEKADAALADFEACLRINPAHIQARSNRGLVYAHTGEYDKARADFDEVIRREPKEFVTLVNRGALNINQNRLADALADFEAAVEAQPEHPKVTELQQHIEKLRARVGRSNKPDAGP